SLANDGIDGNGGFAGCPITEDQLPLAATDGNHRIARHNPGLHRLIHAASLDHHWRNFLRRVKRFGFDRSLAIKWLTKCVYHTTQKSFADGNGKQPTCRFSFGAFFNQRVVTHQNGPNLSFFQVQRETEYSVWKFDHLAEHDVAQTFDTPDAIARFTYHANIAFGCRCFQPFNFCFHLFKYAAHDFSFD